MNKLKKKMGKIVQRIVDKAMGNGLMQEENTAAGEKYITPGMPELIRRAGTEGMVLLENDGVLPLQPTDVVSVFGRCQYDWFYVGYGSGGDVHPPYYVSLMDGLDEAGVSYNEMLAKTYRTWRAEPDNEADHGWWGHWPYYYPEMPLTKELVEQAALTSDIALVVIGRAAGEDRENTLTKGSYYLTDTEREMLRLVCDGFRRVVVIMNCGSVIDLSFVEEFRISALLYAWQGGQESGRAVTDVLTGKVNPCGRLADTIACSYDDYSSAANFGDKEYNNYAEDVFVGYRYFESYGLRARYPFGYGLSYTDFAITVEAGLHWEGSAMMSIRVENNGDVAGRQVVQIYCMPPEGKLEKPKKWLAGFVKTGIIEPGESETIKLRISDREFASYDDTGVTGYADAFVMEPGRYVVAVGDNCETAEEGFEFNIESVVCVEQCSDACAPREVFEVPGGTAAVAENRIREKVLAAMPKEIEYTGDKGIMLQDVKDGKYSLEEFVAQLSDEELCDLTRGEGGMGSALGIVGNAGAFGGITEALRARGIPALITADGPAGLRIRKYTALLPCGTALACTWDTQLIEELFDAEGREAKHFGVDVVLSPGMNIHRNPLCGRNFEYYSEDPLLCGRIAAAAVRGIQKGGASACPKHFACNNQEVNRNYNDSRVSRRALREIYLRGFEICVKEGRPQNLMTSYNKVNGVWSHYNYELVTQILRGEWGYEGNVLTDWWMRRSESPEFKGLKDNAYRVRAQVDVLMPGSISPVQRKYVFDKKLLASLRKENGITRGELQRTAMNVLRFALTRM